MADAPQNTEILSPEEIGKLLDNVGSMIPQNVKDQMEFLKFLNVSPKKEWIKYHPISKVAYIPIGIIETMMQRIFWEIRIEVLDHKQIANSITVCVRVHYKSPVSDEWKSQDGLGAAPIQIKAEPDPTDPEGKRKITPSAIDFAKMQTNAIQLALPAAKSYAIKDACEHIGALFGRDITRKETLVYTELYQDTVKDKIKEDMRKDGPSVTEILKKSVIEEEKPF